MPNEAVDRVTSELQKESDSNQSENFKERY